MYSFYHSWSNSYQQSAPGAAAIFYQIFKGKKYKAADSLMSSFIATAVTQKAVLIPVFLLPPVMLMKSFLFFNFVHQPEEEPGSAGEQPASNKAVATICRSGVKLICFMPFFIYKSEPI